MTAWNTPRLVSLDSGYEALGGYKFKARREGWFLVHYGPGNDDNGDDNHGES